MQVREQAVEVPHFFQSSFTPLSTNIAAKENLKGVIHSEENLAERVCEKENAGSLHNRLHHEAEKIRKWKVQTEIELKQKDQKIHEATRTIDSLRKSTLELQLQNENLSLKLQEELANREEILQKIGVTRNMCDILKNYNVKVEDRLGKCETERTDLKFMEREYITEFEVLSSNFKELSISTSELHRKLSNELQTERDEKQALEANHQDYVQETEEKMETLLQNCHAKDIELNLANAQICEDQSSRNELQQKYVALENRLSEEDQLISEQKNAIMLIEEAVAALKLEKSDLKTRLAETCTKLSDQTGCSEKAREVFQENEKQLTNKLTTADEQAADLQAQLDTANTRVTELLANLTKAHNSVEDLKSAKDMLILERADAKKNKEELEAEKKSLTLRVEEQGEQLRALSVNQMALTQDYATLKETTKKSQADWASKEEAFEQRFNTMQTDLENKESTLQKREEEINDVSMELNESREREAGLNEKITLLQAELNSKSGEHLSAFEQIEKHSHESKALQKELNSCKKEIAKFKKDIEKSLTKDNQTKVKLEKALDESKSLKSRLNDTEKEFKSFKEQSEASMAEKKEKIVELNGVIEENAQAKETLDKQFVVQMNRMMASMDKAQQESQQLMLKKDQQLKQMKKQIEQNEEVDVLKKKLDEVNKKVEQSNTHNLEQEKKAKEQEKTISELQEKLDATQAEAGAQRSILRQSKSVTKKRRVAFESADVPNMDSDSSGAEIDLDEMKTRMQNQPTSECRTPLLLRQSPYVRGFLSTPKKSPALNVLLAKTTDTQISTPKSSHVLAFTEKSPKVQSCTGVPASSKKSPNVRTARTKSSSNVKPLAAKSPNVQEPLSQGKAAAVESKNKKRGSQKKDDSELEKFKKLFPEKKVAQKDASNVRRAPTKSPGKFFNKPSPKPVKKKSEMDTTWFESDAVFGFGPED